MKKITLLLVAFCASFTVFAHEYKAGEIRVVHPYSVPTLPGKDIGSAYIGLENKGPQNDQLIGASSDRAERVEIHTMSMEGDVMKMRQVSELEVKGGDIIKMKPGMGYHLMIYGVKPPLKVGDKFPLKLQFKKSGSVEVSVMVQERDVGVKAAEGHSH
ncbi:copper chaperone PCu(A)C [Iodobacter ciconiae]|uniref:Copper chaperone PCu(A)C n=1 Tax=Iodobacter ciconiae TaxID=2496266 RepID=A0A3S8ZNS8_9NEIS|nr:copper chaperone PCu(A)C [Iodobacter ciconiae]AZN35049.1 copper chaperone PCu(A)C [Iodobacter ciconiae]